MKCRVWKSPSRFYCAAREIEFLCFRLWKTEPYLFLSKESAKAHMEDEYGPFDNEIEEFYVKENPDEH